jgi:hypothetical protein
MATKVREAAGAMERILLPRLNSIDGELKAIDVKIDSMKSELRAEIKVVDTKVDKLDRKLDMDRRMAAVETKIKELERKR